MAMDDERSPDIKPNLSEKVCVMEEKENEYSLSREKNQVVVWKEVVSMSRFSLNEQELETIDRCDDILQVTTEIQDRKLSFVGQVKSEVGEHKNEAVDETSDTSQIIYRTKKYSTCQMKSSQSENDEILEDFQHDDIEKPNPVSTVEDEDEPVSPDSIKSIKTMFKRVFRNKLEPLKSVSSSSESLATQSVTISSQPSPSSSTCSSFPLTPTTPKTPITVLESDLWNASRAGDVPEIQSLLSAGADTGARDLEGFTALHWTTERGSVEAATVLLAAGADVNSRDVYGCTSLHYAAAFGHTAFVQMLLDHNVDVNCRNHTDSTALNGAVRNNNEEVARLLRAAGAQEAKQEGIPSILT